MREGRLKSVRWIPGLIFLSLFGMFLAGCTRTVTPMSLSAVSIDPSTNKGSITLGWNAPTTNTDGTAVDDLAGYRVRIGTSSGTYATTVDVGATTTTTIPNLISGQTYYFVVSAINTSGAESNASAEVSKVAP